MRSRPVQGRVGREKNLLVGVRLMTLFVHTSVMQRVTPWIIVRLRATRRSDRSCLVRSSRSRLRTRPRSAILSVAAGLLVTMRLGLLVSVTVTT